MNMQTNYDIALVARHIDVSGIEPVVV